MIPLVIANNKILKLIFFIEEYAKMFLLLLE